MILTTQQAKQLEKIIIELSEIGMGYCQFDIKLCEIQINLTTGRISIYSFQDNTEETYKSLGNFCKKYLNGE